MLINKRNRILTLFITTSHQESVRVKRENKYINWEREIGEQRY